jgi:hypothetical protein
MLKNDERLPKNSLLSWFQLPTRTSGQNQRARVGSEAATISPNAASRAKVSPSLKR